MQTTVSNCRHACHPLSTTTAWSIFKPKPPPTSEEPKSIQEGSEASNAEAEADGVSQEAVHNSDREQVQLVNEAPDGPPSQG